MIFCGIDPGQKGAVGIIDDEAQFYGALDLPLLGNGEIDAATLFDTLHGYCPDIVFLEKAQGMPGQGRTSIFNYGQGYGKLKAVIEIDSIPYQEIHPTKWKRVFSLIGKDKSKKDSVAAAEKMFPGVEFRTPRGRLLDGRAEALLLAQYARQSYRRNNEV